VIKVREGRTVVLIYPRCFRDSNGERDPCGPRDVGEAPRAIVSIQMTVGSSSPAEIQVETAVIVDVAKGC
jgi:hypothetical protein